MALAYLRWIIYWAIDISENAWWHSYEELLASVYANTWACISKGFFETGHVSIAGRVKFLICELILCSNAFVLVQLQRWDAGLYVPLSLMIRQGGRLQKLSKRDCGAAFEWDDESFRVCLAVKIPAVNLVSSFQLFLYCLICSLTNCFSAFNLARRTRKKPWQARIRTMLRTKEVKGDAERKPTHENRRNWDWELMSSRYIANDGVFITLLSLDYWNWLRFRSWKWSIYSFVYFMINKLRK